jgi:bifunctional diaminopimelate decarboxylase / aspartate kinase
VSRWVVLDAGAATPAHAPTLAGLVEERIGEGLRPLLVLAAEETSAALADLLAARGLSAGWLSSNWFDAGDQAARRELAALSEPVVLTPAVPMKNAFHGGSSITAASLAAAVRAERCEIWMHVPGMFTADPDLLPSARLLRVLDYDEALEISITRAGALPTRSIVPLRLQGIPLHLRWLERPDLPGTLVSGTGPDVGPQVKAVLARPGITLISMDSLGMLHKVGFLAEAFARFARHGVSIDAISTSETNITVSLDTDVQAVSPDTLDELLRDLNTLCEVRAITQTASLSLVGRGIRAILHEIGPVLEVFEEMKVHLVTQSASDLNLTFVVDEDQAERLVRKLHGLLFQHQTEGPLFGPTWEELHARPDGAAGEEAVQGAGEWWRQRREDLLALAAAEGPLYVYDAASLHRAATAVRGLRTVDRVFYSVKANCCPGVLACLADAGLGFECVSVPELEHVRGLFPEMAGERLLFTPNFAPREEYRRAFELGAWVTLDSLHPLRAWPELFAGREVFLRLDPGQGRGHHAHVRTAGVQSKFGIAPEELADAARLADACGARVVGLHAHAGSGIRTSGAWGETAAFLGAAAGRFPHVRVIDVGGGLGVPERPGQSPLDLAEVDAALSRFKESRPGLELWIEPGRFLVAQAGVLLARVVQVKRKGDVVYVGLETGMNSLIRPALYGAYHPIVNLTRLDEPATLTAHVVGPICETGDVLGRSRRLAPASEGDVLLIANAGAYGRVMSSWYNLRVPAGERVLGALTP